MAGEDPRASSSVRQGGGIREEQGALAGELEPRGEPGWAAGRQGPAAGHSLLWRLRPEDERARPDGKRAPVAVLRLRARLPGWRRKDLPVYDFAPGRRCRRGSTSGSCLADQPAGSDAGAGSGRARLDHPTPPAPATTITAT